MRIITVHAKYFMLKLAILHLTNKIICQSLAGPIEVVVFIVWLRHIQKYVWQWTEQLYENLWWWWTIIECKNNHFLFILGWVTFHSLHQSEPNKCLTNKTSNSSNGRISFYLIWWHHLSDSYFSPDISKFS